MTTGRGRRFRPAARAALLGPLAVSAALLTLAALPGCERGMKRAIGDRNQLIIFSDEANWNRYGALLTSIFERQVETPQPEYVFRILRRDFDRWEFFTRFYTLIVCASLAEDSPTGDRVRAMLSEDVQRRIRNDRRALAITQDDPYAIGQRIIIITAETDASLVAYLNRAGEHIFSLAEEHLNRLTANLIYRQDEQYALEDSLQAQYGFVVRVPWGFRVDRSFEQDNFVRMIKYQLERWFFAYWVPGEEIDRRGLNWLESLDLVGRSLENNQLVDLSLVDFIGQQAMNLRDDICRRYYDGDTVVRERMTATIVPLNGRWAVRLYGTWVNERLVVGGPVVAYCFFDPATGRVWWLDGAVFAPNQEKEGQLRQMDVMLKTFMSGEEATRYLASVQDRIRAARR